MENGYLIMMPYENVTMEDRAMIPQGWQEIDRGEFSPGNSHSAPVQLVLLGIPEGQMADLENLAITNLGIEELPMAQENYISRTWTWDLDESQTDKLDIPGVHVLLALAEGDRASYAVVILAIKDAYLAGPSLYEMIFCHAVPGLSPLELSGITTSTQSPG